MSNTRPPITLNSVIATIRILCPLPSGVGVIMSGCRTIPTTHIGIGLFTLYLLNLRAAKHFCLRGSPWFSGGINR
ncbi:Uncharacterised protein [Vibrio cholerae]|nr:Uncharacterised protein [Vibrio cholerae]CSD17005.1 Uncharacterised protein [Vibrio cholerae]